jgi:hypothetical protein
MSENDVWKEPTTSSVQTEAVNSEVITGKATKKRTDGDGTKFVGTIGTGAIGVTKTTKPKATAKPVETKKEKEATVAIYSSKNVVWDGVGKVSKGYNIVTKSASERWLVRGHIREATPEEVSREYGN